MDKTAIELFYEEHYPDASVVLVNADSPDDLEGKLAYYVENGRFPDEQEVEEPAPPPPSSQSFRFEAWPTEHWKLTQFFGANPQNYAPFNLPGHEGVDFRAPHGSKIFAVASGVVSRVGDERVKASAGGHNYGVRVYIDHVDGYQTVYAHLNERIVDVGDVVIAGQVIGYADNTGNSFGSHLHLTLKKAGATAAGATNYPYDIIDPTPYLLAIPFPNGVTEGYAWAGAIIRGEEAAVCRGGVNLRPTPSTAQPELATLPFGTIVELVSDEPENGYYKVRANVQAAAAPVVSVPSYRYQGPAVAFTPAIHAPADDWQWSHDNLQSMLRQIDLPVKFMSNGDSWRFFQPFRKDSFDLVRLFWKATAAKTAAQAWADDMAADFRNMYNAGARHFELHNEPNLPSEGLGLVWANGSEFGQWLSELIDIIRAQYSDVKLYFPGMSPGVPWTNQFAFTDKAWPLVKHKVDGFCCHAYTGIQDNVEAAVDDIVGQVEDLQEYLNLQVPLVVSECSVNRGTDYPFKALVYQGVQDYLSNVDGVHSVVWYISAWHSPPEEQKSHGEAWLGTDLPNLYTQ